jgi:hypothetical protein
MKKWLITFFVLLVVGGLYVIEISKISTSGNPAMPTLDELQPDTVGDEWEPFYRVRATIIDGQTAEFSIPKELQDRVGQEITLTGAAVFYSPGCEMVGEQIAVSYFYIFPSLGLTEACTLMPDVAMRWTVRINPKEVWLVDRTDMISAMVTVRGFFRIDTSKPYESAFFIDDADITLISE